MVRFEVNGQVVHSESPADTPLLWVLRDELRLKGTKFGCGIAQCGACTVRLDGRAARSCVTPLRAAADARVTTIEGLDTALGRALQEAWVAEQVPQCGYSQSGQIMQAADLLGRTARLSDDDIRQAMNGNLCRCCGVAGWQARPRRRRARPGVGTNAPGGRRARP